jgi:hypothetical protein
MTLQLVMRQPSHVTVVVTQDINACRRIADATSRAQNCCITANKQWQHPCFMAPFIMWRITQMYNLQDMPVLQAPLVDDINQWLLPMLAAD